MLADISCPRGLPPAVRLVRKAIMPLLVLGCLGQASCSSIDRARRISDVVVEASQQVALQTVIEASVERQRLRRLRCIDPLLTPATISRAAMDARLGQPWVDELLRDCPAFSAFLAQTAMSRLAFANLAPRPPEPDASE